jgi:hypothetical protein
MERPSLRRRDVQFYIIKCLILVFVAWGVGSYLIFDTAGLAFHILGILIGLCGFVLLIGMYGVLRGITPEKLQKMRIRCVKELDPDVDGAVDPSKRS